MPVGLSFFFSLLAAYGHRRARRIRERGRRARKRGKGRASQERASGWVVAWVMVARRKEEEKNRWTGKKNTVANQTENTFSVFLYLFRVNICSGNIRCFVSFLSLVLALSFLIFFNVYNNVHAYAQAHIDVYLITCIPLKTIDLYITSDILNYWSCYVFIVCKDSSGYS